MTQLGLPILTVAPADAGPRPGIVVAHEGHGLTPQMIRFSERLARDGYLVAAPEFFFRVGGPEARDMRELIHSISPAQRTGDVATAIAHLRALGATSVGIVGFCMGGTFAYVAANTARELGIDAAVGFYGARIPRQLDAVECPTLLFFGGNDRYISMGEIELVREHHGDIVIVYPDARHGFMRDGSRDYSEPDAADAWRRMLDHFATHLS